MNLDDAQQTFIVESLELLQQMEDALLHIELTPDDDDTINAIFRAAHTIKGSAGLFGLDDLVAFTHVAESVLDRVRDKQLHFDEALTALFLQVCDHIGVLVKLAADNEQPQASVQSRGGQLLDSLRRLLGAPPESDHQDSPVAEPESGRDHVTDSSQAHHWHISLRLGHDLLRNGMDPLAFIRYLSSLGHICNIVTLSDSLPPVAEMDPESCYLGFEIGFDSSADQATIEGVFDFIREDSQVHILAPHSNTDEYRQMIQALPQESLRMGEIFLLRCGTHVPAQVDVDDALRPSVPRQDQQAIEQETVVQPTIQPRQFDTVSTGQNAKDVRQSQSSLIRIDAGKLDQLINLVGELIIAGAGANLAAQNAGASELIEATAVLARLVEEVRDSALTLRMVQIGSTFNRFQRVVRDVAKELGKDIRLEISGGETELDKTVVERISDPLTHLVRNAMDHGIEPAEVRLAQGKPAQGRLRLNAYHDAGSIVIEVADDGGGLNTAKILRKAIERGLVNEGQHLVDQDIFNLIFEPGFSTAEQVSNLSGRGVGMDVVKRNITALRGSVELDSIEGQGTTLRIRLPLTLAIIDGFRVEVGSASYVIPQDMVVECIELPANEGLDYLNLRGEVLPLIRLRELFDIAGAPARRENVVVVQFAGQRAGLMVDRLLGEFQTVIKPLGKVFGQVNGIGGFTILGSGEVALILDVAGLVRQVAAQSGATRSIPTRNDAATRS
ncbi:two-component system, chemotaxis family, sensor kinase CheA [Pseudomonas sp. NFACC23-1]|uniref:chemotaxis protein CheA n=1 Tax=unclassified Pseudomonas TaxID=196821 RepID=UPI000884C0E4|nr:MULTISPECIES: chemotaxis protein CheA [unclassified Pseudomonas]SDB67719.1 two-component system, chemotaxis family, sensor kinase CheA [Pseudomonas sp. NFACC17-2]SEI89586.1 two-component system, chemotaxis family, sensor kinase CheA [Pseudomonas sp. NFACC23-1]SFW93143.1 two-component system, chemotaxis family, sensor kinase CheA [Pseudomonas sp. NFACC16-2]